MDSQTIILDCKSKHQFSHNLPAHNTERLRNNGNPSIEQIL
jgi:hypothetical protein